MHRAYLNTAHHSGVFFRKTIPAGNRRPWDPHNLCRTAYPGTRKTLPSKRVIKGMRRGHTPYLWYANNQQCPCTSCTEYPKQQKSADGYTLTSDIKRVLLGWPLIPHLRLSPETFIVFLLAALFFVQPADHSLRFSISSYTTHTVPATLPPRPRHELLREPSMHFRLYQGPALIRHE